MATATKKPRLFEDLNADEDFQPTEIQSLCVKCEQNGVTRLLLTRIPFYGDVVVMSFSCTHCGEVNNELQPAAKIQEKGVLINVQVRTQQDLNRQVVKMDTAEIRIPKLEFVIPANTQKGTLTTVEGVVMRAISGLEQGQEWRRSEQSDVAAKLDTVIASLRKMCSCEQPWSMELRDPSGNSFVETSATTQDGSDVKVSWFDRTREENESLGLQADADSSAPAADDAGGERVDEDAIGRSEVLNFRDNCPNCNAPTDTRMKPVSIPHFKEVVVMATHCDSCGHRSNEVKSGSGMEAKGHRYTLTVRGQRDLNRDVLKSEMCVLSIPLLQLEHETWVRGGKFTTVEGLLTDIQKQLFGKNPFVVGDSAAPDTASKMADVSSKLDKILSGDTTDVEIILDDPAGNSYIQSLESPDEQLVKVEYERTNEQNDALGLNDMNTEDYAVT